MKGPSPRDRNGWWRRSLVQKTVSFVENDLHHVLQLSPFLQKAKRNEQVAFFHRSEILTGELLGKGGFSEVYEIAGFNLDPAVGLKLTYPQQQARWQYARSCRNADGSYRFAIKILQEHLSANPKDFQFAASDLVVEAAYLSSMDHPNILPVRGLPYNGIHSLSEGRHDGYFIITDKLCDTLDNRVEAWKKSDEKLHTKAQYAQQLASALRYLHDRHIVFRDLKPQNIGFSHDDRVQLFDFGLCRELPPGSNVKDLYEMSGVGTRRYMAVEVIVDRKYNLKVDVYGWAMIFWEMLSLSKPFESYSMKEHHYMVCTHGDRPLMDYRWPETIVDLIQSAWRQDVAQRLDIAEVESMLSSILRSSLFGVNAAKNAPISPTGVMDLFPNHHHHHRKSLLDGNGSSKELFTENLSFSSLLADDEDDSHYYRENSNFLLDKSGNMSILSLNSMDFSHNI